MDTFSLEAKSRDLLDASVPAFLGPFKFQNASGPPELLRFLVKI
jgi:hypothetical protein